MRERVSRALCISRLAHISSKTGRKFQSRIRIVNTMQNNQRICSVLRYLKVYRLLEAKKGESRADDIAITAISGLNFDLTSGKQALDAHIPNIGQGIARHIDEILSVKPSEWVPTKDGLAIGKTGVPDLDTLDEDTCHMINSICDLMRVSGITFKKAHALYEQGIYSANDLPEGELTHREAVYLQYLNELSKRIPREEIKKFVDSFGKALDTFNARNKTQLGFSVTGSYRRELPDSRAIDLIMWSTACIEVANLIALGRRCSRETISPTSLDNA